MNSIKNERDNKMLRGIHIFMLLGRPLKNLSDHRSDAIVKHENRNPCLVEGK